VTSRPSAIRVALAERARCTLEIFDPSGGRVRALSNAVLPEGSHTLWWDLTDARGRRVPAGIYLLRARIGARTETQRVAVIR
jgi:flagellar hook assembly protein FlgD